MCIGDRTETARLHRRRAALRLRSESPRQRAIPMEKLLQDLRFAIRNLRHTPGFTTAVIVTIALGVDGSTRAGRSVKAVSRLSS